jgi:hypothetical protein
MVIKVLAEIKEDKQHENEYDNNVRDEQQNN